MTRIAKTALSRAAILLPCLALLVLPAGSEDLEIEVEHLLSYVEQSGCTFIRNEKDYTASRARSHLERKYDYAKSKIKNADQFIETVGSGSSRSGKPYRIRCGAQEYIASEWLDAELNRYRTSLKTPQHEVRGGSS